MTESNFWADFVRWLSNWRLDDSEQAAIGRALQFVASRDAAYSALATIGVASDGIDDCVAIFSRTTGRTPPADARSVDVPPTGGLPKPERVEVGQRWLWEPGEVIESVQDDDGDRLCLVGAGGYLETMLLSDPGWVYLGKPKDTP